MKKAKVTISRPSRSDGKETITISITDAASGATLIKVALGLSDFARALTGHAYIPADIEREPTLFAVEHLGMEREVERLYISTEGIDSYGINRKGEIRERVKAELEKPEWEGWSLFDDGCGTQQNVPGKHKAVVCRYVKPEGDK